MLQSVPVSGKTQQKQTHKTLVSCGVEACLGGKGSVCLLLLSKILHRHVPLWHHDSCLSFELVFPVSNHCCMIVKDSQTVRPMDGEVR